MLEDPFYYREEAKHQRAYIRRVVGLGIAACMVFLLAKCAYAAEPLKLVASFEAPNTNGELYDAPCKHAGIMVFLASQGIPPAYLATVKAAAGTYEGKSYQVCWLWNIDQSGAVVVWEDNTHFIVLKRALRFANSV